MIKLDLEKATNRYKIGCNEIWEPINRVILH